MSAETRGADEPGLVRYASRTALVALIYCVPALASTPGVRSLPAIYTVCATFLSLVVAFLVVSENQRRRALAGRLWQQSQLRARLERLWRETALRADLTTGLFLVLSASVTASVLLDNFVIMIPGIVAAVVRPRDSVCVGVGLWVASLSTAFSVDWLTVLGYAYLVAGALAYWVSGFARVAVRLLLAKRTAPQEVPS